MPTPVSDQQRNGGFGGAAKSVAEHASAIARLEIELATFELKQKVTALGIGIGMGVGAAIFALFGLGFVFATFLQPHEKVKEMFDAYRGAYKDTGLPGGGGVAYMPLVFVADNEREAEEGAKELTWYLTVNAEPQFKNPPGYVDVATNVQALKGAFAGRSEAMRARGMEFLREQGIMVYGTPDQCVAQIKSMYDKLGGFDHLLMMMQAGYMGNKRTVSNIRMFAKEVYPQIKDLPRSKSRPWTTHATAAAAE